MSSRRVFLFGAISLGVAGAPSACTPSTRKPKGEVYGGVDFKVLVPNVADDRLPLVVAIHGRAGAPEHWIDAWSKFPGRAAIALPRGFQRQGRGFSWFPWTANMKDEKLAAAVTAAEERLWLGIVALAAGRRVVVAGYAQGGVLTFVTAARRGDVVAGAFPVGGACPDALFPAAGARAAPLVAFHGTNDDVVPIAAARASVEAFTREGSKAELREYAGVGHDPSDKMHADLQAEMVKCIDTARSHADAR